MTNTCCDKHNFVLLLSRETRVCGDKIMLVATNICVFRDKHKSFVATSIFLSPQKTCLVATNTCSWRQVYFCTFVATKMILVAAPANDSHGPPVAQQSRKTGGKSLHDNAHNI